MHIAKMYSADWVNTLKVIHKLKKKMHPLNSSAYLNLLSLTLLYSNRIFIKKQFKTNTRQTKQINTATP